MNLFRRKDATKRWRRRAMLIDPHKTRITLTSATKTKRLPPWVYKKFVSPPKELTNGR